MSLPYFLAIVILLVPDCLAVGIRGGRVAPKVVRSGSHGGPSERTAAGQFEPQGKMREASSARVPKSVHFAGALLEDAVALEMFRATLNRPFDTENVRVISLVDDTATRTQIDAQVPARLHVSIDPHSTSIERLSEIFAQHRGRSVFLIGHVEGDNFVIEQSDGSVSSRLSIREIQSTAARNNINFFAIGCESAKVTGRGAVDAIRTTDAIKHLSQAIQAATYWEFFTRFTSGSVRMEVDQLFVEGLRRNGEATLYETDNRPIGKFWFSHSNEHYLDSSQIGTLSGLLLCSSLMVTIGAIAAGRWAYARGMHGLLGD